MKLFLHTPKQGSELSLLYKTAFAEAQELFLVSAYLTDWDSDLKLNQKCTHFRVIVGQDFGITRKAACTKLLNWLPGKWKASFLVAKYISGFHPKAMFWKTKTGQTHALIGSSNLTRAAFDSNYEANFCAAIDENSYQRATEWCDTIEENTVIVDDGWIEQYREAPQRYAGAGTKVSADTGSGDRSLELPKISGAAKWVQGRRTEMSAVRKNIEALQELFRKCAAGQITSPAFYEKLAEHWGSEVGNRLQGKGFEIKGKHSDFARLSESFVKILDAPRSSRDNIVRAEIDSLAEDRIPTRGAFLSEMLCQSFPENYPLINEPVLEYLRRKGFKPPSGASEGAKYIYRAKTLRRSLIDNPDYVAKDLAELDAIIWHDVNSN